MPVCNICGCSKFIDMAPNPRSIFVRQKVLCEACHSLERHRLLFELLNTRGYLKGSKRVLHIAPELGLAHALESRFGEDYVACDLDPSRYPGLQIARIDLCGGDLAGFTPASFDIVIHNHVIEHLPCDWRDVLRRLDALVAPGGVHAFTVPFMEGGFRETFEPVDDAYRLEHFGQTDHYRVFSPRDAAETIGAVLSIPDSYDATTLVSERRLREIAVPESQWRGYNNNSVFFLEREGGVGGLMSSPGSVGRKPAVLFVSANGIGRGHITRQLAIAERLRRRRPFFLTMSYAAGIVARAGFAVQFLPHHDLTGELPAKWHLDLAREIELLLDKTGADTLVYDVNFIFDGVIEVLRARRRLRSFWIRRALWPEHHRAYIGAGVHFTHIIEPGDLAEAMDAGPTVAARDEVTRVPPVLLTDPGERLSREAARDALDLPRDATVVMVDMLSTDIGAYVRLRERLLPLLLAAPDVVVIELKPVFGRDGQSPLGARHRIRALDDAYRFSKAWDAAVVRCGYNTFHEQIFGAVPSVFVPNSAPDMDRQDIRARWAVENGCGAMLDVDADAADVQAAAATLLDPPWRSRVTQACGQVLVYGEPWRNGASEIAGLIDAA